MYENAAPRRDLCRATLANMKPADIGIADLERLRVLVEDANKGQFRPQLDAAFRERLERAKRVWLTLTFEGVYLAAWLSFVAWPLFAKSRLRWHWRLGLAPFLLFLPYFLGYAPMTFTFGPSGGFVYPGYLALASLPMQLIPCSVADRHLWRLLPKMLASLSQIPGSPAAVSYMACVGPASSLAFGLVLVALVALITYIWS